MLPLDEANCASCHASDLRGGTGTNRLRSANALSDKKGELILAKVSAHNPKVNLSDGRCRMARRFRERSGRAHADRGPSNPPETFMLDGKQHFLFNTGIGVYMFVLN